MIIQLLNDSFLSFLTNVCFPLGWFLPYICFVHIQSSNEASSVSRTGDVDWSLKNENFNKNKNFKTKNKKMMRQRTTELSGFKYTQVQITETDERLNTKPGVL